jgi:hypothetical protein
MVFEKRQTKKGPVSKPGWFWNSLKGKADLAVSQTGGYDNCHNIL